MPTPTPTPTPSCAYNYICNYITNIMEEFINAHIYSTPKQWRPYLHNCYPIWFKDQAAAILSGHTQPTCILYNLPIEILHRIFEYAAPAGAGGDEKIQQWLQCKTIHKKIEGGAVIIDCPTDANYYLGKIYISPATYNDIISVGLDVNGYTIYNTNGKGLYFRDYLYENTTQINGIALNILCNSNHQQPFPLYKITNQIKIVINSRIEEPLTIEYELLDLEKTQERAQSPMLQEFLDKMKPNTIELMYEQMQIDNNIFPPSVRIQSLDLNINLSIKTLMWKSTSNDWVFNVNDNVRFEGPSIMFNKIIPYKHYEKFMPENVHLYSFVSNPTDYRYQFGLNCSRIDHLNFVRKIINDERMDVYAINSNILVIDGTDCTIKYAL